MPTTPVVTAAPIVTLPSPSGPDLALSEARRFVFRVRNDTCLSTGTAFEFRGQVITNRHVAASASGLQLATWDGRDFNVPVRGHSASFDLAVLGPATDVAAPDAPVGPGDPRVGEQIYVTGYPKGDALTVTSGRIVASAPGGSFGVAGTVLEVNASIQPGNSGSPVLDSDGRVVGVVFALETDTGLGLAMPLSSLKDFLAAAPSNASVACPAN